MKVMMVPENVLQSPCASHAATNEETVVRCSSNSTATTPENGLDDVGTPSTECCSTRVFPHKGDLRIYIELLGNG